MPTAAADHARTHVSVALGAAVLAVWLTIHIGGIFFWDFARDPLWLVPILVLIQAEASTGLFIVAHDAMHGSFAPGRPALNRWAGRAALALYACMNFDQLRDAHFRHHKHAGLEGDPDFHPHRPRHFLPWLGRFFGGYYNHTQLAWITLVAIIYQLSGAWLGNIVVFWAIPAITALLQLFYFGTYLPHRHRDEPFPDRHRARSNSMGRAAAVATCYNFGAYHHEHHLFPDTPWWALPRRRSDVRAKAAAQHA
ncbi:MAG: fatty acid desaturase [Sphingomonadaceae bacterium]|nr:fatty acid desaturase [Sphingomonadaceae bacterium]